jgi:hypothetical protein
MRFLMIVCVADMEAIPEGADLDATAWVSATDKAGQRVMGERLGPADKIRTVRVRGGRVLIDESPFAGSGDYIGGFDILDCASMDEAVAVASRHPIARYGALELRPFWPFKG